MNITLEEVQKKIYSAELEEKQKYHYWCACSDGWTTEQAAEFQNKWNEVQEKVWALRDLENAIKKAKKFL